MIDDSSRLLQAARWTWTAISTLFVAGRLYGRTRDGIKLGSEDFWIIPSLVIIPNFLAPCSLEASLERALSKKPQCCSYSMSIIATIFANDGAAKPVPISVGLDNTTGLEHVYQFFAFLGLTTGKISVMCLIRRLQSPTA